MIYLPNPKFDFENCEGGGILTQLFPTKYIANTRGIEVNLDFTRLLSKFKNAQSNYFDNTRCPSWTFCFLREDGAEFALRVIPNTFMDVIGYWKDLLYPGDDLSYGKTFDYAMNEYTKFLRWLEPQIQN